jgi:hypothetical protein
MLGKMAGEARQSLLRAMAGFVACLALWGCAGGVGETKIARLQPNPPKVTVARVDYVSNTNGLKNLTKSAGHELGIAKFNTLFATEFRDSFPQFAQAYGLTISPTSKVVLKVQMTKVTSSCQKLNPLNCVYNVDVTGTMVDEAGRPMWTISSTLDNIPRQTIHDGLFQTFATVWLEDMKKQGVIG